MSLGSVCAAASKLLIPLLLVLSWLTRSGLPSSDKIVSNYSCRMKIGDSQNHMSCLGREASTDWGENIDPLLKLARKGETTPAVTTPWLATQTALQAAEFHQSHKAMFLSRGGHSWEPLDALSLLLSPDFLATARPNFLRIC